MSEEEARFNNCQLVLTAAAQYLSVEKSRIDLEWLSLPKGFLAATAAVRAITNTQSKTVVHDLQLEE